MKLEPELKQLIDAYIDEVGLNLPRRKRGDIAVEMHSLIMDALEDRAHGTDLDQDMVMDVLKEFGPPIDVAASYHPHNYVIGPRIFAPFWLTVRGSLVVLAVIFLAGFLISLMQISSTSALVYLEDIGSIFSNFLDSALQAFAVIVLVFIVLERTIPDQDWVGQVKAWAQVPIIRELLGRTTAPRDWDPTKLKITPKSERISRGETIFEVAIIILVAILFNFFAHRVGAFGLHNGEPWFMPLLAPTFGTYLPWWNLYWLLTIGLNFVLLSQGHWTRTTRWAELGMLVFSGIIVYFMLIGPPILGLNPEYLTQVDVSTNAIQVTKEIILPVLTTILKVFLVLHLIGKGIKLFVKLFRLLGKPPVLTWKIAEK